MIDGLRARIGRVKVAGFPATLALLFTSLLFFYDLLGGRYLLSERDLTPYYIPPRFFWVESLKNGTFPLWNPYQFCGQPFFANPQQAILYPLNLFFFILPFDLAFNAIIILHFFLGGLFTYLLLRDLEVDRSGALLSALVFMLGGFLLSLHSLLSFLLSVVWTPLMIMFFRRAMGAPGLKYEILTALSLTLSFLGGGLEVVYGNGLILFLMVFFNHRLQPNLFPLYVRPGHEYAGASSGPGCGFINRCLSLAIVLLLFISVSAVQLLPFLELSNHWVRQNGLSYTDATVWSFAPRDILLFFLPDAYGYFAGLKGYWTNQCWFKTLYTGGLPFVLGAFFFIFGRNRAFFVILFFTSLFFALGKYNPLYSYFLEYLPFLDRIRYPVKFLYIFFVGLSVLAGLGWQRFKNLSAEEKGRRTGNLLLVFSLLSAVVFLLLVFGHGLLEDFLKSRGMDYKLLFANLRNGQRFFFYLTVFFLLLKIGYEVKWRRWITVLFIFVATLDLFGNLGFYQMEKTKDYFRKTSIQERLSGDEGFFRVFSTGKTISFDEPVLIPGGSPLDVLKEKHLPTFNLLHKFHDIWGIDVTALSRVDNLYKALTGTSSINASNLLKLYGVKYVISVTPIKDDPDFELVYARLEGLPGKKEELLAKETVKLYQNHNFLPRGFLVSKYRVLDSKAILNRLVQKEFDPASEALLEEEPTWTGANSKTHLPSKVEFIAQDNNRLSLKVTSPENALLVLSDTYYPGWKAIVDGRERKIYRADYTFRAVPLEPGEHQVEFRYDPLSFKLGLGMSGLSVLGMAVYLIQRRRRSKPPGIEKERVRGP